MRTLLTTFAAFSGGNLTGNGTAMVHYSFGLFWCGTGAGLQGYAQVSASPCAQGQGNDIKWAYYPKADSNANAPNGQTNPNYCPPPLCGIDALKDFSADHRDWVGVIESAALKSFTGAFANFPIRVTLATSTPDCFVIACFATDTPDQDYTVYVLGDYPFAHAGQEFSDSASIVNYFALMEGAEEVMGQNANPNSQIGPWVNYLPTYPPQDSVKFLVMLRAIGTAIGNSAAHEIGHHLEKIMDIKANNSKGLNGFPFMDCGLANTNDPNRNPPIPCEKGDNFVYNFFSATGEPQYPGSPSSGGMFFYGVPGAGTIGSPFQPAIHWGPSNILWLQNYAADSGRSIR